MGGLRPSVEMTPVINAPRSPAGKGPRLASYRPSAVAAEMALAPVGLHPGDAMVVGGEIKVS
jgi:hypothetical protein